MKPWIPSNIPTDVHGDSTQAPLGAVSGGPWYRSADVRVALLSSWLQVSALHTRGEAPAHDNARCYCSGLSGGLLRCLHWGPTDTQSSTTWMTCWFLVVHHTSLLTFFTFHLCTPSQTGSISPGFTQMVTQWLSHQLHFTLLDFLHSTISPWHCESTRMSPVTHIWR